MKIYYILALIPLTSINALVGMDVSALYDRTMEAIENEPVPAGMVILVSKEGKEFQLPQAIAQQSKTLQGMMEDIGADRKIPLSNISTQTLEEIVALLQSLHRNQNLQDKGLLDVLENDVTIKDPFTLLAAANYLDIQSIITLASRKIALNLTKSTKNSYKKTFENIVNKVKESSLLEHIFHQYYLLTGTRVSGLPAATFTLTQQERSDYPPQTWTEPAFPKKALSLLAASTLASSLLKSKKHPQNYMDSKTIILTSQGHTFEVPLSSALQSSTIKNLYEASSQTTYDFSEIPPETLEIITEIMQAIENLQIQNYFTLEKKTLNVLARHVPSARKNIESLLYAAIILKWGRLLPFLVYLDNNQKLPIALKSIREQLIQHFKDMNSSLSSKEIQLKVKDLLTDLIISLRTLYFELHSKIIQKNNFVDFPLSIQDYLNKEPKTLTHTVKGDYMHIHDSHDRFFYPHQKKLSVINGFSLFEYENSRNLRHLYLNSVDGLSNIPKIETITYLNLDNNLISNLGANHFLKMKNLERLSLRNNNIEVIYNIDTFSGASKLVMLDLSSNPIKTINPAIFKKLPKLKYLFIDTKHLDQPSLDFLYNYKPYRNARYTITTSNAKL